MRQRYTLALIAAAVIAVWYGWPQRTSVKPPPADAQSAHQPVVAAPHRSPTKPRQEPAETASPLTYEQCKSFLSRYARKETEYWQDWSMDALRARNVDDDDIALALYHHRSSNAAASYLLRMLRRDAPLTRLNQTLMQQARAQGDSGSHNATLRRKIPHPHIARAVQEGSLGKLQFTDAFLVDDIAWLIRQSGVSDAQIRSLLDSPQVLNTRLGSDKRSPPFLHLIDVAARQGRIQLVMWMLDSGALPTSQRFLPSTLDAVLAYLSMALRIKDRGADVAITDIVDLLERLMGMGQQAGFTVRDDGSLVASFHARSSYFYDPPLQQLLAQNYGFYIDSVPRQDTSETAHVRDIRQQIEADWQDTARKTLGDDPKSKARQCIAMQQSLWNVWDLTFVNVSQVPVETSQQQLTSWYRQSPILTSCYRNHLDSAINRAGRQLSQDKQLFAAAAALNTRAVVRFLEDNPDGVARWFYELIMYRPELYATLVAHGFMPVSLTYSMLASGYTRDSVDTFSRLHAQGFDFSREDKYGRTLLYVAARKHDFALLQYFIQENVPYYQQPPLPDPLYLWLWRGAMGDRFDTMFDAIALLMTTYAPAINAHHQQLMAAIDLKHPALYQRLVAAFPALNKEQQRIPQYVCAY